MYNQLFPDGVQIVRTLGYSVNLPPVTEGAAQCAQREHQPEGEAEFNLDVTMANSATAQEGSNTGIFEEENREEDDDDSSNIMDLLSESIASVDVEMTKVWRQKDEHKEIPTSHGARNYLDFTPQGDQEPVVANGIVFPDQALCRQNGSTSVTGKINEEEDIQSGDDKNLSMVISR